LKNTTGKGERLNNVKFSTPSKLEATREKYNSELEIINDTLYIKESQENGVHFNHWKYSPFAEAKVAIVGFWVIISGVGLLTTFSGLLSPEVAALCSICCTVGFTLLKTGEVSQKKSTDKGRNQTYTFTQELLNSSKELYGIAKPSYVFYPNKKYHMGLCLLSLRIYLWDSKKSIMS
jgi:hypothetical protein